MRNLSIILLAIALIGAVTVVSGRSPGRLAEAQEPPEVDVGIDLLGIVGATGDPPTITTQIYPAAPDLTIVKEERITHSTPVDQKLHFQWFPPPGMTWHCERSKVPAEQGQNVQCTVSMLGSPESRVQDPNTKFFGVFWCPRFAPTTGPISDCKELHDTLDDMNGDGTPNDPWPGWASSRKNLIEGANATEANLAAALNALADGNADNGELSPGDELVVFTSSLGECYDNVANPDSAAGNHGNEANDDPGGDEGIIGDDGSVITDDELSDMLSIFPQSVTITVIVQACHSGGFVDGSADLLDIRDKHGNPLTPGHIEVLMSAGVDELAGGPPLPDLSSYFGNAVRDCLKQKGTTGKTVADADYGNGDGVTTSKELFDCAEKKTADQTSDQHPQYKDNRTPTTPPPCPTVPPFKYDHELNKCKRIVPDSTTVVTTAPTPPDTINTCTITEGPGGHPDPYVLSDCDLDYEKTLPAGTPGILTEPGEPNFEQTQPWNKVVKNSEPGSHEITECVTIQPEDPFVDPNQADNEDCLTFVIDQEIGTGGLVELFVGGSDSPASAAEGSGSSGPPYAAIAGAAAAAAIALAAGGWYARRRLS